MSGTYLSHDTFSVDAPGEPCPRHSMRLVDLAAEPAEAALAERAIAGKCLEYSAVPWRQTDAGLTFATSRPELFWDSGLPYVLATSRAVQAEIERLYGTGLSERANRRCPEEYSCRTWFDPSGRLRTLATLLVLGTGILTFPVTAIWIAIVWILINLAALTTVRLVALGAQIGKSADMRDDATAPDGAADLPVVSLLVPLHDEGEVLPQLIRRLGTTDYPRALLDICLVVEAGDHATRLAIRALSLPGWIREIVVPPSTLQTKPRAMNYALDFCQGEVIGIYDAEDAPETDQISRIVAAFAASGPDVACIQGYLDFYNADRNWLARCFTIEYAIWFRVILHGLERLGLPVPLGGTGVFFRRSALEALGACDAHNVTEDADLGFRLARLGWRCRFLATTTFEEANCAALPWIRQRSRWLKGYAMTWITHMQNPAALWRDLGPRRFAAFQVLLLGTVSNFVLAPFVWLLWARVVGFEPAFTRHLPDVVWLVLGGAFVLSEVVALATGLFAVRGRRHRHLLPWVLTMPFYWPLGTLAVAKALYELIARPFYWDKTRHGRLSAFAFKPAS